MITWQDVLNRLQELTPEQLAMSASIFDSESEEIRPITDSYLASDLADRIGSGEILDAVEEIQPLLIVGEIE